MILFSYLKASLSLDFVCCIAVISPTKYFYGCLILSSRTTKLGASKLALASVGNIPYSSKLSPIAFISCKGFEQYQIAFNHLSNRVTTGWCVSNNGKFGLSGLVFHCSCFDFYHDLINKMKLRFDFFWRNYLTEVQCK